MNGPHRPQSIILDFARVPGIDASAAHSLGKLSTSCARAGLRLVCSGMRPALQDAYLRGSAELNSALILPTLDGALRRAEEALLAERPSPDKREPALGALAELAGSLPKVAVAAGGILLREGAASTEMFVLLSGAMRAEITRPDGTPAVVARFVPGAIIGEIAFYSAVPRTATVIADEACVLLRIDADSLEAPGEEMTPAARVHAFAATSLARRLKNVNMLLRDAEF